ncbi:MAG: 3-deoxy-D-manno-octulosonic acid transferase [Phycisphaerales bacterium]
MNALDFLYVPLAILSSPWWARKKREGWDERSGKIESMLSERWTSDTSTDHSKHTQDSKPVILLHAVSVGEVNALRALVPLLVDDSTVVISTTTDTGLARAQSIFSSTCEVVRYPLDCSWMVKRFFNTINPQVVGLVELEVWPNFVRECTIRKIPVGLINGRLSARSFKGYRKARFFIGPTFKRLSFACMQDSAYAARVSDMGAPSVQVTGTMKWDAVQISDTQISDTPEGSEPSVGAIAIVNEMGLDLSKPIVVAGSTGPGEESLLRSSCPDGVQLVCAPRKPDRFEEAAAALEGCVRRSSGAAGASDCYLLDTIGELSLLYEIADVVVIGRSFFDLHGSDPLEAAALGKPVLIGPEHSDFTTQIEALRAVSGIQIVERAQLGAAIKSLIAEPIRGLEMGQNARRCVIEHQGASEVHAQELLKFVK